ncbi:ferredoxin--nitrite reductase [Thiomicrolovo sp. ZZH C-3]
MISVLQAASEARNTKTNKVEQTKALKTPKEAFEQIAEYAKAGYGSIPKEDLGYFLKCFGIFDRPMTPERFMMRVRIPGGQLDAAQARTVGEIAKEYGQDYMDISTRAQIVLRYLSIEAMPEILERLENVGLTTFHTGVDNFRNMVNDPLDGVAFDNILPSQGLLQKLQELFLGHWEWVSALPRKFNTGVCGSLANRCNIFGQDCGFVLAQKEGVYGYNVYLGGRVGVIARNADIFVRDEAEAVAMFRALIELYRDYGFRDNRNKNRLHFLIEAVGMEALAAAIREKAGIDFATAGETLTQLDNNDSDQGRVQLNNGTFAVHAVVPSGVFSGSDLVAAAEAAETFGDGRVRLDIEQSLYLLGVDAVRYEALMETPFFGTYQSVSSPYFNHLIACAGEEHCPFGVIPNKPDAIEMAEYLSRAVPLEGGRVRMHWSGCVKGCGLHGVGDVGFEGCKAKVNGETEHGVHITLGGKLTSEGQEGYSVMKSVPLRIARYHVESLMREYRRLRNAGESFGQFHDRVLAHYSPAAIGFIMQLQAYLRDKTIALEFGFETGAKSGRNESFELFDFGCRLYKKLTGETAYPLQAHYMPSEGERLDMTPLDRPGIDANLARMVVKMLEPNTNLRAKAFTEVNGFVALSQA